jgi:hypothetical protein
MPESTRPVTRREKQGKRKIVMARLIRRHEDEGSFNVAGVRHHIAGDHAVGCHAEPPSTANIEGWV